LFCCPCYYSFIYGGWGGWPGNATQPYDELHILSLPAFRWFKVPYPAQRPRIGHTCHVVGQRHMLIIGGADPLPVPAPGTDLRASGYATPDPFPNGLGLFDITRLQWATTYDPRAAEYEQSAPVAEFYRRK
jgi:hypothetical protein